jgi:phenylacetate-coenzyme A ligase PaaK-like adenylate-forming protein
MNIPVESAEDGLSDASSIGLASTETKGGETLYAGLLDRLSDAGTIDPVNLADLFALGYASHAARRDIQQALRLFLARRTVHHANAVSPYYRDRSDYGIEIPASQDREPDLTALPILTRSILHDHAGELLAEGLRLRSIVHSSGTTGQPVEIYKSFEEVEFVGHFFRKLFAPAFALPLRPISLGFPTPHHGAPIPMPSPALTLASGVTDDTLIQDAARVLRAQYAIAGHETRVSTISGMGFQILFFTSYLLEQGIDPRGFELRAVNVAGGFVPAHWRRFLEDAWGSVVNDRYSLTETVGGATRCKCCHLFKPDPQILVEVLDVDSDAPIAEGVGKLVVTNLYPFAQMMPLIRYDTGDLVRLARCPRDGTKAFEFLGRRRNCISLVERGERHWLVLSAPLHEILATIPDLNVFEWFSNVRVVRDRTVGSLPIVAVREEQVGELLAITIRCELRYSPHSYQQRATALRERIAGALRDVPGTALTRYVETGAVALTIEMLGPGAMTDPYVIKI